MPEFADATTSPAPPEAVWKLLYDPARFPEWWAGLETVEVGVDAGRYTMYPDGYPDFPMAQAIETSRDEGRVVISCLVSDLRFRWLLGALDGGEGTAISVEVQIPEAEAHRLDRQRQTITASLRRLAALAAEEQAATGAPPG